MIKIGDQLEVGERVSMIDTAHPKFLAVGLVKDVRPDEHIILAEFILDVPRTLRFNYTTGVQLSCQDRKLRKLKFGTVVELLNEGSVKGANNG